MRNVNIFGRRILQRTRPEVVSSYSHVWTPGAEYQEGFESCQKETTSWTLAGTLHLIVGDVDALPPTVINALQTGQVNLDDPAVTVQLLSIPTNGAYVGAQCNKGILKSEV
jgi:hypothetical protein